MNNHPSSPDQTAPRPPPDSSTATDDRMAATAAATVAAAGTGERARRARTEPMTLRPLRDGRTVVETDGGTYVVGTDHECCTCPDHAIRGVRCKHLRRVAIEAAAGRVPPAGMRQGVCAICGRPALVGVDQSTALCAIHEFEPGELVVDRETGSLLVVVAVTATRADDARIDDGRPIADVESNQRYGDHEPVVRAVYVNSLARVPGGQSAKRYGFPASRLRHTDRDPARGRRLLASHQRARARQQAQTADAVG